ncbi:hypothetical protein C9374_007782 [Naegleria lovaniensis]|uniref:Uncharacterized protein n=1 Tax=Naegleria lovaniensis TaxID=51637 RepID=A0AA88GKF6_NAELO|nr:uncharacterized protein C9374_007782 [Naegleria lovaniensis]KAG2379144.1 hypothetical protein C9374_007782 [Naegleria lovaniensis]
MGQLLSNLFPSLFGDLNAKILMLGLDAAGKTATLYKLHLDEDVTTIPTIGFNVETVQYRNVRMTIFDLGGQYKIRQLWRHYYQNNDAIIFIVDSADRDRMEEARETLHQVLESAELQNVKLLVLANKQDLPQALSASQVAKELNLNSVKQEWFIQPCSARTGKGLYEGFDWLSGKLK